MNMYEGIEDVQRIIDRMKMQLSELIEKNNKLARENKELDEKNKKLQGLVNAR